MNPIKKLASQTAVYGLSQILGRFINYLLVPLHTAIFNTAEYGVNALLYSYVIFFNVLLTYGMETAFFRFSTKYSQNPAVYSTIIKSLLISSLSFVFIGVVFSHPIAAGIKIPSNPEYVIYFCFIIGLDAITSVPFAMLRQQNKAARFAVVKNISIFINIVFNLYFLLVCPWAHKKYGVLLPGFFGELHVGQIFIANLISSIITFAILFGEIKTAFKNKFDAILWKEMMVYALPIMVIGFAGMINEALDRIVISYIYPSVEEGMHATGIYSANYKLSIAMTLFIQAFRYAAEPFFFNHAKKSNQRNVYATVMNYFVVVCLVVFLTITLYLDWFKLFINYRYWEGLKVVPILLLANLFLGVYYNLSVWYKLSDNTGKGAIISVIGAIITVVFNLALVPVLGYEGSAWATLICYASMAIMCYIQGAKYYPIPYTPLRLVGYMVAALGIFYFVSTIGLPLPTNQTLVLFIKGIIIVGFGLVSFWFEKRNAIPDSHG